MNIEATPCSTTFDKLISWWQTIMRYDLTLDNHEVWSNIWINYQKSKYILTITTKNKENKQHRNTKKISPNETNYTGARATPLDARDILFYINLSNILLIWSFCKLISCHMAHQLLRFSKKMRKKDKLKRKTIIKVIDKRSSYTRNFVSWSKIIKWWFPRNDRWMND